MPSLDVVLPKIPKGRMGTVKEVSDTVEFLLEPRSEYITGQSLVVDGGPTVIAPPFFDDAGAALRLPGQDGAAEDAGTASDGWARRNRRAAGAESRLHADPDRGPETPPSGRHGVDAPGA